MIEKVDSTSTTSIQPLFDFNAQHNGVDCIASLNPADKGTERQFWFTIAMLVLIFDEQDKTIRRNIDSLIEDGEIVDCQNCQSTVITKDSMGRDHETRIYNLEVLNKLGMCCFRGNKKAKEIRNKFNDVLIKDETQAPMVLPQDYQPTQPALPQSYLEALKALVAAEEAKEAAQKALEAEKEQHEADNRDFCEGLAILESKKAEIGSRREAKAMSKAAVAVKQCKKLESRVADLEDELGRGRNWMYINLLKDRWIKRFGHKPDWRLLKAYCDQIGIAPIKDVEGVFVDAKGGQHPTKMYRYPIAAWKMYYEWEMSLMQSLS